MKKHLFLTGEKQIGKSTVLNRLLEERERIAEQAEAEAGRAEAEVGKAEAEAGQAKDAGIDGYPGRVRLGGFWTVRAMGVYDDRMTVHLLRPGELPTEENLLFFCKSGDRTGVAERFDRLGCAALANSEDAELILMDELGPHEMEAELFRKAVLETLDGDIPVWGVLQKAESPFLAAIAERPDVELVTVTEENRDELVRILTEQFIHTIE